jgi:uncharacterized protein
MDRPFVRAGPECAETRASRCRNCFGEFAPLPICWGPYNGIASERKKITTPSMRDVPSPCTGVCRIDPVSGLCAGCKRTLTEIADWPMLNNSEKRAVLQRIDARPARG